VDIYTVAKADPDVEIKKKRTERAKVFQLPGGRKRHLCFGAPIHYWTKVGEGENPEIEEFDDIDIRLVHSAAEATKTFGNHLALKNKFTYGFRDDDKSEKCIGIRRGADNQMEWTPKAVKLSGVDKVIPITFTSSEKTSDFSFKHSYADYDIVTSFNEVHIRTAVKTKSQIDDFLIQEIIDLKGITVLNKTIPADSKTGIIEYLPDSNNEFRFETTDGEHLWIPTPKMWTEDTDVSVMGSQEIIHRLYKLEGILIYEKVPTVKGKVWLASKDAPVFIDGDTYTGSTGDGYITVSVNTIYWLTYCRNRISANNHSYNSDYYHLTMEAARVDNSSQCGRGFFFFDTSGVTETPTSVALKIRGYSTSGGSVSAQKSTIAGTTLDADDQYNDFSGSEYGHVSWSSSAWNTITFNSTGINDVDLDGYTKICTREYAHDYVGVDPSPNTYQNGCYFADDATYKPYLDIVEELIATVDESVDVNDSTVVQLVAQILDSESIGVSDSVSVLVELGVTLSESVAVNDSLEMGWVAQCLFSESVVVNDGTNVLNVKLSESVVVSDLVEAVVYYGVSLSESGVASDSNLLQWEAKGVLFESLIADDSVTAIKNKFAFISESLTTDDAVILQVDFYPTISESLILNDSLAARWVAQALNEESVDVNDGTNALNVKLSESLTVSESAKGSVISNVKISESLIASDSVTPSGVYAGSILTIEGNEIFAVGDILRIKDGIDDEWMEILSVGHAPAYRVERDKAGNYAVDSNPEWKKGASVVNYGQSGDGGIYMTASEAHAPYLSVFTHAGEPWSTITTHIREGNLNGYAGYTTDLYGWAAYIDDDNYIKIDPTNGIRMSGSITITGGSTTLDAIANGVTYGRVQTAVLDSGYLYLMRRKVDATEQLLVTASGIEGYANNVKNFELASGIAYLGDQSNEHVKLSSLGMQIKDGATLYATYGATTTIGRTSYEHIRLTTSSLQFKDGATVLTELSGGSILVGQTGAGQSNVYITSGAISLRNNVTDVITISNAGVASITVNSGGDISLTADNANPGLIKFVGTTYTTVIGGFLGSGTNFFIRPETNNVVDCYIGGGSLRFSTVSISAVGGTSSTASVYGVTTQLAQVYTMNSNNSYAIAGFIAKYGNVEYDVSLDSTAALKYFHPSPTSVIDLGGVSYKWKDFHLAGDIYSANGKSIQYDSTHKYITGVYTGGHSTVRLHYDAMIQLATNAGGVVLGGVMYIAERASATTDIAGYGQLWVKNEDPCELWFTDDAGTDTQIV